jgi:hypothetical protein
LEGYFNCHLWDLGSLSKRWILLAQIPIFLDMTTCLAHHPNWSAFDSLTTSRTNQKRIFGASVSTGCGGGGSSFCCAEASRVLLAVPVMLDWNEGR